jgi:hypothetical protein
MKFNEIPSTPPARLTEAEVIEISGLAKGTLATWKASGRFPKRLYRTREGNVYNGKAVYKALGYDVETKEDPFL